MSFLGEHWPAGWRLAWPGDDASLPDTFKMRRKSAKEARGEREGKNS